MKYLKSIIYVFFFLLLISLSNFNKPHINCFAEENTENSLIEELNDEITAQLDSFDFTELDNILVGNPLLENSFSFREYVEQVINGEKSFDLKSVINIIITLFKNEISTYILFIVSIIALSMLSVIGSEVFLKNSKNNSISSVVNSIFYSVIVIFVCYILSNTIYDVVEDMGAVSKIVEIIFPILLTCLVSAGGSATSVILQPSILFFVSFFIGFVTKFLMPIIIIGIVLKIVSNISDNIKLEKLNSFINSLFKWTVGMSFTIFIGILALQGLTASSTDSLSIKTAKYAIRSYVPLIGGYLSEGFEIFRAGSILIKNSIGMISVLVLFIILIGGIINILVINLMLKFTAGVVEPLGATKISKFLSLISSSFVQLLVVLLAFFFSIFILILIILSAGNFMV